MTQNEINLLFSLLISIQTSLITLMILKVGKYTIKLINYIRKKIKEN